jgi:uncharacterized membrane protein
MGFLLFLAVLFGAAVIGSVRARIKRLEIKVGRLNALVAEMQRDAVRAAAPFVAEDFARDRDNAPDYADPPTEIAPADVSDSAEPPFVTPSDASDPDQAATPRRDPFEKFENHLRARWGGASAKTMAELANAPLEPAPGADAGQVPDTANRVNQSADQEREDGPVSLPDDVAPSVEASEAANDSMAEPVAVAAFTAASDAPSISSAALDDDAAIAGSDTPSGGSVPPPLPPAAPPEAQRTPPRTPRTLSINFEDLFGRRLPIWAGGVTLAVAGFLIVKYAIDIGLFGRIFTPWVQAVTGFLFGAGLIAGAEWAHRARAKVDDPRVSQALSGAGIATLYGVFLVAGNVYTLIPQLVAFLGLAAVTATALWLSIRHGVPSALLGLAGGLATPAMVGGIADNVPLLSVYLAFTIGGLTGVSRMQRWPGLGLAALVGGAGWSLWIVLASSALDTLASLSIGGFIILTAIALPLLAFDGARAAFLRTAAAVVGAAQLAMLVAIGGFAPLNWGLFVLLAAAGQWLAWRDRNFDIVPTISLGLSALLLAIWPMPESFWLLLIGVALTVIHAVPLLAKLWRDPPRVQLGLELCGLAIAAPLLALRHYVEFDGSNDGLIAIVAAIAAIMPVTALALGWQREERLADTRYAWLTATTGLLAFATAWFALPDWQGPLALGAIAALILIFGQWASDRRIEWIATGAAILTVPMLLFTMVGTPRGLDEFNALVVGNSAGAVMPSLIRWGGLAALFGFFALRGPSDTVRRIAQLTVAGFAYGAIAQLLPGWALPLGLAAIAATMLAISVRSETRFGAINAVLVACVTLPLLLITMPSGDIGQPVEAMRLFLGNGTGFDGLALMRWGGLALLFAGFASFADREPVRTAARMVAAGLTYGLLVQIVPGWALVLAMAVVAGGLLVLARRTESPITEGQATVFAGLSLVWLAVTGPHPFGEWVRLFGQAGHGADILSVLRWAGVTALCVGFAAAAGSPLLRRAAQTIAAVIGYGAVAQAAPTAIIALIAPVALLAAALAGLRLAWPKLREATVMLTAIAAAWTLMPLGQWLVGAIASLGGEPMIIDPVTLALPMIAKQLIAPALLVGLAVWIQRHHAPQWLRTIWLGLCGITGAVALHILYRMGFAAAFGDDFIATGLAQRSLWAALLIAGGYGLHRFANGEVRRIAAPALVIAGALHTLWYTLILHNPLWTSQAVGAIPVANLIAPMFVLLPLALILLRPTLPRYGMRMTMVIEPVKMLMITGFAWATLRHAFHGTMLVDPGVSSVEDIARSILGIALAITFLLWGIRIRRRDWRLASLVLMLAATVKVFLFDASGLEGLLRIGSFVALGFSLIGIGWLYSRQLKHDGRAQEATAEVA